MCCEPACPHQIKPVRTMLENQKDNLLAFTAQLDRELANLAQDWQISTTTAQESPGAIPTGAGPKAVVS